MIRHDDPLYAFYEFYKQPQSSSIDEQTIDKAFVSNHINDQIYKSFTAAIWNFYRINKRQFMWRDHHDPYVILVSEIMLQQTQTQRVAVKLPEFLTKFPTVFHLAQADTQELFQAWVGLGYNRRALALRTTAQMIVEQHAGKLPDDPITLQTFAGIGPATAASIAAFAYNKPTVFIETNIRSVYLHVFFHDQVGITDDQLRPFVENTLDPANARQWYYALMDYGVYIKKTYKNPSRGSKHHTKQSKFEGSDRQVRGAVIRLLSDPVMLVELNYADQESLLEYLKAQYPAQAHRVELILEQMCSEKIIQRVQNRYVFAAK